MRKYEIVNYIEIDGKDVRMDAISEEEKQIIQQKLPDSLMIPAGYKRKTA